MADTVRDLLLARADDGSAGLLAGDVRLTWAEVVRAAAVRSAVLAELLADATPAHVGLLLDNVPEFVHVLGGAALGGQVVVGLNTTRRGQALVDDVRRSDTRLVLTDATHAGLLDGLDLGVPVVRLDSPAWSAMLDRHADAAVPTSEVDPDDLLILIFTSGTSGTPKAVNVTHAKVAGPGELLAERFALTGADVAYLSMPLFHSNAIMAGWAVGLAAGAALALAPRFSASGFLPDVRRYGATYANYVGKPLTYVLSTPAAPGDADNPLRLVFGNEANERDIAAFAERFDCTVVDSYSSTENAVIVQRVPDMPVGALGRPLPGVAVLSASGDETPDAVFGPSGELLNAEAATGELVNTTGGGAFAGYYNDPDAEAERMRGGMYWSGDLAYRDADGFVYFAGRTADWLRVDGENLAAAPIERVLLRHPAVAEAAVYAVPDEAVGDQVAAALVLRADLAPDDLSTFLDAQPDLSPKAWPRLVRLVETLPRTATNKVLKRELASYDAGRSWVRDGRGTTYRDVR